MMSQAPKLRHNLLIIAILLVAFLLRLAAIDQVPPGLSHDEANNGMAALQLLESKPGQWPIFFEINKGIEPLIIYLEALAFRAFGVGPVSLRLVNIFCGWLTVALVYPLALRLANRRVALLAMAGIAIFFWPLFVSRLTLRAVTFPPLVILTLYFLLRGLESQARPLIYFGLSGLMAGASMYTYLANRFIPLLVVSVFGYALIQGRTRRVHRWGLLLHFSLWAAIFAPLATYYLQHRADFTQRYDQVTVIPHLLNGEPGPLVRNTGRTLAMFTFSGDQTDRYNLDGRPLFDWANGLLFYLGLGVALLGLGRASRLGLLPLWLGWMLMPDFITDDSPHFLRTIGAMPAVYILWALGLERLRRASAARLPRYVPRLAIGGLLLLTTLHTTYDYFGRWASAPEARHIYGADIAEIARYLKKNPDEGLVAISAEYYRDMDPFRFALHNQGHPPFVLWFDGRQALAFPPPQSGLSPRYIFAASAPPADPWQPFLQPDPAESGRAYTLYHLPDSLPAPFPAQNGLSVNVNNELILTGYRVLGAVISGGKFQVLLGWQALRPLPPGTDYTFLVRLRDAQGHLWAEDDGSGYRPMDWQPGVQGLQLLTLRLPGDLPPRTFHLAAQVVDRSRGQPLPTDTGQPVISLASLPGQLAHSPRLIDPADLPNPTNQLQAEGPELALRGYRLDSSTLSPGDTLALTLHWQVLEQPAQAHRLAFSLLDGSTVVHRWPPLDPVGGEWPTSAWPGGYWVQDRLSLPIDPAIPPGQYSLRGRWTNTDHPQFELGTIQIEP